MNKLSIILGYARPYKKLVVLSSVCFLLASVFSLISFTSVIPFLDILFKTGHSQLPESPPEFSLESKNLLGYLNYKVGQLIAENGQKRALLLICGFVVVMFFLKNLMRYMAYHFLAPLRNGVMRDIRERIEAKLLTLPIGYFSEERKGNIMSKVTTDVAEVEWAIIGSIELLFRDPITLVIYLTAMILLSWQLTLFVLVLLPVSGFLIGVIAKSLKKPAQKGTRKMGDVIATLEETLTGIKIIKAFGAERQVLEKFRQHNDDHFQSMIKVFRRQSLGSPSSEFFGSLALATLLWFGGSLILDNSAGFDGAFFITYIVIFSQMIQPAKAISEAFFRLKKGMVSVDRINEILKAEPEKECVGEPVHVNDFHEGIELKNLVFFYQPGRAAIDGIDLEISKGETIALVGQSGGGKTTLANLIPRFYEVSSGEILLDGVNISRIPVHELRKLMGIVTQESILFNDTVMANITLGLTSVAEEEVVEAARIANAHEFIVKLEQGYHTNIGDLGNKLSGGQRQRLSIARAIIKNPPILILDEATSALDTESERLVQDAIIRLMQNRTSIVIAHRLSTIQHANRIVVIQQGKIVESGKHDELLAKDGHYRKLYDMQSFA